MVRKLNLNVENFVERQKEIWPRKIYNQVYKISVELGLATTQGKIGFFNLVSVSTKNLIPHPCLNHGLLHLTSLLD